MRIWRPVKFWCARLYSCVALTLRGRGVTSDRLPSRPLPGSGKTNNLDYSLRVGAQEVWPRDIYLLERLFQIGISNSFLLRKVDGWRRDVGAIRMVFDWLPLSRTPIITKKKTRRATRNIWKKYKTPRWCAIFNRTPRCREADLHIFMNKLPP